MSSLALNKTRDEALALSQSERAELAHDLVASLDGAPDNDATTAWEAELQRRLDQIEQGAVPLVDRDEFNRRLHAVHDPASHD